jgi:hypothetical protein
VEQVASLDRSGHEQLTGEQQHHDQPQHPDWPRPERAAEWLEDRHHGSSASGSIGEGICAAIGPDDRLWERVARAMVPAARRCFRSSRARRDTPKPLRMIPFPTETRHRSIHGPRVDV